VVDQWTSTGQPNQQWQVTNLGNSRVKILNAYSGMALSVSGNSNSNGASIVQTPWANSNYQIWTLIPQSNGSYVLQNVGSGLALDDPGWSTTAGVTMDQWTVNSAANQQWKF
jgi:mannan endo-1,4-beta-mannosidase